MFRTARMLIGSKHFYIVACMLLIVTILQYPQQLLFIGDRAPESLLGTERHALERVLFLLPIMYAGVVFGMRAGMFVTFVSVAIMLPRDIWISEYRVDASLETAGIAVFGVLVNIWFESYQQEHRRRERALSHLMAAQEQLESQLETIRKREAELAAINSVSVIVSESLEIGEILARAASKIREVMDVDIFLAFLRHEETGDLVLERQEGLSPKVTAEFHGLALGEGLNGQVALTGEPLLIGGPGASRVLRERSAAEESIAVGIIVPIKSKGKVLGTFAVGSNRFRRFPKREVDLLLALGNVIGVALENARLYQKQRETADALRSSEKAYRELFENAHDAIIIQDLEGNIVMTNAAGIRLGAYTEDELTAKNVREFLTPEGMKVAREVKRRLLRGEVIDKAYDQQFIRKDGSLAYVKLTTSLITDGERPRGFQHIARDVTEEKRLEENLRFYLQEATRAQEEERKRIARELHDDTAQELVALSRELDRLASIEKSPRALRKVEEIQDRIDEILDGVRRFSQDLRPSVLDDLGLLPALQWLTADMQKRSGISVDMKVTGKERRLLPEVELLAFRIAQEALRNVWKHSEATHAHLLVEFRRSSVRISVSDDGKGFSIPERTGDLAKQGKLGLAGMEERARLLGGRLELKSRPGEGAVVTVEMPVEAHERERRVESGVEKGARSAS
ncbi:MAG: PAS domain S-box protein [Dehalococcoidia bacterium]|nr:PAS domain S-box protein [Dehalococcoidia bacterium]